MDGQPQLLPDEVLWRSGWAPYREARVHPGSTHFTTLEMIPLKEAVQIAEEEGLPVAIGDNSPEGGK